MILTWRKLTSGLRNQWKGVERNTCLFACCHFIQHSCISFIMYGFNFLCASICFHHSVYYCLISRAHLLYRITQNLLISRTGEHSFPMFGFRLESDLAPHITWVKVFFLSACPFLMLTIIPSIWHAYSVILLQCSPNVYICCHANTLFLFASIYAT